MFRVLIQKSSNPKTYTVGESIEGKRDLSVVFLNCLVSFPSYAFALAADGIISGLGCFFARPLLWRRTTTEKRHRV